MTLKEILDYIDKTFYPDDHLEDLIISYGCTQYKKGVEDGRKQEVICIHRDPYFVSKSGEDSNCGDADHPFLTIERAMEEIHFTEDEDAIVSIKKEVN